MRRRLFIVMALLHGCAAGPADDAAATAATGGLLSPWRTLPGGFLVPPPATTGLPPRAGSGMYVKWMSPGALALRGPDLLVADVGSGRLWRVDTIAGTIGGVPGAPVGLGTALQFGPDRSAWVLDPDARQVLRFAFDGRLMQTHRAPMPALPRAFALTDGAQTLLLADGPLGQWTEIRTLAATATAVRPQLDGRVVQVDAIAVLGTGMAVLDRAAGAVHLVQRDGRIVATLGQGELVSPVAIAVDRLGRIFVLEADARRVHVLQRGAPTILLDAAQLGAQQIGGIAVDDGFLAVSDRLLGQVVIHRLRMQP